MAEKELYAIYFSKNFKKSLSKKEKQKENPSKIILIKKILSNNTTSNNSKKNKSKAPWKSKSMYQSLWSLIDAPKYVHSRNYFIDVF